MNFLEIKSGCTVVRLQQTSEMGTSLEEQAARYLSQNPYLLMDVSGIEFNSMNLGELVNVHARFQQIWGNTLHGIGLLNLSDNGRAIFSRVGLSKKFPDFDSIHAALTNFDA